jgi:DNA polymerase III delta subunit
MIYLFLGPDTELKDKQINEIKAKLFPSQDAISFDLETLHGHKLSAEDLKKALVALPVMVSQRLVILRQANKLSASHKELILDFIKHKPNHLTLILDSDESDPQQSFVKSLAPLAKIFECPLKVALNVFDMTGAIQGRRLQEALKVLHELFSQGDHPLQVMGGLVWFWGKIRNRLSADKFKKGLQYLQEADFNIKRSRLRAEYAVEMLVVELCSLV